MRRLVWGYLKQPTKHPLGNSPSYEAMKPWCVKLQYNLCEATRANIAADPMEAFRQILPEDGVYVLNSMLHWLREGAENECDMIKTMTDPEPEERGMGDLALEYLQDFDCHLYVTADGQRTGNGGLPRSAVFFCLSRLMEMDYYNSMGRRSICDNLDKFDWEYC